MRTILSIAAAVSVFANAALADIFQWEYVNPADPSQGKRQSMTLAPDGAGVEPMAGANLYNRDLTMAYLSGADLTGAYVHSVNLTNADLSQASLANANFSYAMLTGANLTGADVRAANFPRDYVNQWVGGITLGQLYSTASYQSHDLGGTRLRANSLAGGNFAGQNLADVSFEIASLPGADFGHANLSNVDFRGATLTDADFREANLTGAFFYHANLTGARFAGQHLVNANFGFANLTNVNFAGQNLTDATFDQATLADAHFSEANLTNVNFYQSTVAGADFIDAEVRGANFSSTTSSGFTPAQLYSTVSYQSHDLTEINLTSNDLTNWNFSGQNLTSANFNSATLTGADFTGAEVREADFKGFGITLTQLYSTHSYQAHDLTGITLGFNDLSGGNFARQNLTNASFYGGFNGATLSGADFSEAILIDAYFGGANLTGANFRGANLANANFVLDLSFPPFWLPLAYATVSDADLTAADTRGASGLKLSNAITTNLILTDGHINGLDLDASGLLVVRNHDWIPITVDQHVAMGPGGTLRMVFEADAWNSTISFAPGIPVTLDGILDLTFAGDVNLASQVGCTFDLFDWVGVAPTGAFAISSPYTWDLSHLYTTGEVTLAAVPEPPSIALATVCIFGLTIYRRRRIP